MEFDLQRKVIANLTAHIATLLLDLHSSNLKTTSHATSKTPVVPCGRSLRPFDVASLYHGHSFLRTA